ncbi:N-acetylmuramate alpha-1-phosphate uridylyltransferase MurU [Algiphilus sp.]|uniref:N-acetylmuramate alpha-1-phosphate uridylyltransferase MurU n=1 Tax=Algiphilus sp. TaxID=1872431 RepID=UPI0025BE42E3|nr:nucleotidyltransferase family protein [Algiphilus sp.]MCK5768766.1 nucleotidyltransferase family protein [Algiphilus sp.]
MKAMILAAGRGARLRPETDRSPKPLLQVGGEPLIAHHLRKLAAAGIEDVVVNTGWLGEQLPRALGDGGAWGVRIAWSHEGWPALDTGGGIRNALPLLGDGPFLLANGDVWSDIDYVDVRDHAPSGGDHAYIVLVPNPPHHPDGDFGIAGDRASDATPTRLTYSGVSCLHPALFTDRTAEPFPLGPLLRAAIAAGRVSARLHTGTWSDIGTPARLAAIREQRDRD